MFQRLLICLVLINCLLISLDTTSYAESQNQEASERVIPVFCYHRFGPIAKENIYALTEEEFERQLGIIKEEGFTPLTPKQVINCLAKKEEWPAKPILITIDDGYRDFLTYGKPPLERMGFKATLFVYPDFINSRLGLSREELKQLTQEGYEIGSHSKSHAKLTKHGMHETQEQRLKRLDQELGDSRKKLIEWTGSDVVSLAYPYGLFDEEVGKVATDAGYQLMFTVCSGMNTERTEKIAWHRYMIMRGAKDASIKAILKEQPLSLSDKQPRLGERIRKSVTKIEAIIPPSIINLIDIKSLVAKSGRSVYPLMIDAKTGRMVISVLPTWTKGVNQIEISARSEQQLVFRDSWLIIVDEPK